MVMCFDCEHRNIRTNKGDLECHCQKDGRWHNPYRPMILPDRDCPNFEQRKVCKECESSMK